MATPLQLGRNPNETTQPQQVLDAKEVRLALITYTDEYNTVQCQLAVIGDKNIHLLEGRTLGFSKNTTPFGRAAEWLKKGVLGKLAGRIGGK